MHFACGLIECGRNGIALDGGRCRECRRSARRTPEMDLWRGPLARAGTRMFKRLVPLVAAIGGFFLAMMLATNAARAEKRVALVVGNSNYQTVPQLPNPCGDAAAVAKMFRDAGFDTVDTLINVGNLEFKRAIRKFEAIADQADIAVVYYAGHGLEISGINYLIPIDA